MAVSVAARKYKGLSITEALVSRFNQRPVPAAIGPRVLLLPCEPDAEPQAPLTRERGSGFQEVRIRRGRSRVRQLRDRLNRTAVVLEPAIAVAERSGNASARAVLAQEIGRASCR